MLYIADKALNVELFTVVKPVSVESSPHFSDKKVREFTVLDTPIKEGSLNQRQGFLLQKETRKKAPIADDHVVVTETPLQDRTNNLDIGDCFSSSRKRLFLDDEGSGNESEAGKENQQ